MTTSALIKSAWAGGCDVGAPVELTRYVVGASERVIYGQRVYGVVRVTDVPAVGRGRAYLVERGLEEDGYDALKALVTDYVQQAQLMDEIPMAVSPLTGVTDRDVEEAQR